MKHLVLLSIFVLAACASSKGDKNVGTAHLPETELAKLSGELCQDGKTLTQVDSEDANLGNLRPVIAFVSGDDECAITNDIADQWWDLTGRRTFFNLTVNGCVPNNSLWRLTTGHTEDHVISFTYENMAGTARIYLHANDEIGATYARDHAGIRRMSCQ